MSAENCIRKRKVAPIQSYSDDNSEDENGRDPFSGDDDKDVDYALPKKVIKNPTTKRRRLTPKERLDRLKKNTSKYVDKKAENSPSAAQKQDNNYPNEKQMQQKLERSNFEAYFAVNNVSNCSALNVDSFDEIVTKSEDLSPSSEHTIEHSTPVYNRLGSASPNSAEHLIMEMYSELKELTKNVSIMRKQMARIEAKSIGFGMDGKSRPSNSEFNDVADVFFYLESALATEGLPLRTCTSLEDFEVKLRVCPEYRLKLVWLTIFQ